MNALLVLSSLASIATAAPPLLGSGFKLPEETSTTILRQKKSPTFGHHGSSHQVPVPIPVPIHEYGMQHQFHHGMAPLTHHEHHGMSPFMETFQKPIIVKQKGGYHLFRDSDEEQQQVGIKEKCKKQVKVKLCDDSSEDFAEGAHLSQKDMEKSIKMAKKAVENLQKGLKDMEEGPSAKMAQWKHGDADMEIHEDIEVAREALEHIEKNFENLESMSLHSTTSKNAEVQDIHMTLSKTDKERMVQWKEAIENIQKNVEIARNIEDSFKDDMQHSAEDNHKMIMKSSDPVMGEKIQNQELLDEIRDKKITLEKHADNISEDFKTSATDLVEAKSNKLNQKPHNNEDNETLKAKSSFSDINTSVVTKPMTETKHDDNVMKNVQTNTMKSFKTDNTLTDEENTHLKEKVNEDMLDSDFAPSSVITKTLKTESHLEENKQENIHQSKSASTWENENNDILTEQKIAPNEKEAEEEHKNKVNLKKEDKKPQEIISEKNPPLRSTQNVENNKETIIRKASEKGISTVMKHADLDNELKTGEDTVKQIFPKAADSTLEHMKLGMQDQHTELPKAAEDLVAAMNNEVPTIMKQEQKNIEESPEMKVLRNHLHHSHQPSHFSNTRMNTNNNVPEIRVSQNRGSIVEEAMAHQAHSQGKSADNFMEPSMKLRMRDTEGKTALERIQMLQWKHNDAARSAYGGNYGGEAGLVGGFGGGSKGGIGAGIGSSSGSSGAIGIFPNANVGGCAVPLMLSCSPSVVSGTLASAQPASAPASYSASISHSSPAYGTQAASAIFSSPSSFSAPSYRATEEMDMKKKQETHNFDLISKKVKRNLSTKKLKSENYRKNF